MAYEEFKDLKAKEIVEKDDEKDERTMLNKDEMLKEVIEL